MSEKITLRPIVERCPLDVLGYPGAYVEVLVNPPGWVFEYFAKGNIALDDYPDEVVTGFQKGAAEVLLGSNVEGLDFGSPQAVKRAMEDYDPMIIEAAIDFFFKRRQERGEALKNAFGSLNVLSS